MYGRPNKRPPVVLRLTRTDPTTFPKPVRVEGEITGEWALLLERECRSLLTGDGAILLDLGSVTYIDRTGVEVLTRLARGPVELVNCLPLIAELLARGDR